MGTITFDAWMNKVDAAVQRIVGLSVHDLADMDFYSAWEDGESPASVAKRLLAEEGWEG